MAGDELHFDATVDAAVDPSGRAARNSDTARRSASLIVDPWGRILAEADHDRPGIVLAEIDTATSAAARAKIPNLKNARDFSVAAPGAAPLRGAAS